MEARHFGLLLDKNRCAYSLALGEALERKARSLGVELSYFSVDWAKSAEEVPAGELDKLQEQAAGMDGLVLMSSVFSHGIKSLSKLTQQWWPRPASSIGYRLPLVPSVVVDNRSAMHQATQHLLEIHGRRKPLFIRGRADSQEATDRYFGYRQALGAAQIINDPARVLSGDFTRASAVAAFSSLSKDVEFDAIIASNDEMALSIIEELERKGFKVPDDVAVIGFDDIPAAARCRPSLTTMGQPFKDLADTAIQLVIDQSKAVSVPAVQEVPALFVPRGSCGCPHRSSFTS